MVTYKSPPNDAGTLAGVISGVLKARDLGMDYSQVKRAGCCANLTTMSGDGTEGKAFIKIETQFLNVSS